MSDSDRPSHGLTPVPFEPFADTPTQPDPERDTTPSDGPPEDEMPHNAERPSIDDLTAAMARLETELDTHAQNTRSALDRHGADTKESVTKFLNTVLERFGEGTRRMDAHAKLLRAHSAELRELRVELKLPAIEPSTDDL